MCKIRSDKLGFSAIQFGQVKIVASLTERRPQRDSITYFGELLNVSDKRSVWAWFSASPDLVDHRDCRDVVIVYVEHPFM